MCKKYLSTTEAAKYLNISRDLLQKYRTQGIGIPYIKLGDSVSSLIRYDIKDLDNYLMSKKIKVM